MIVVCPSCASRFQYDEARFQGETSKRFRCPKCSHVFEVKNPQQATAVFQPPPPDMLAPADPEPSPAPEAPTAPLADTHESTARRPQAEVKAMAAAAALPPGMRFSLAFLNGPHASTVRVLDRAVTIIGREEGDIVTQDPETSRRHARLEIHWDGSVWITDLQSTNGTFIEGVQVTGTVRLLDRQEFTCGKSTFMLLVRKEDGAME